MTMKNVTLLLVEDNEFDVRRIMRALDRLDIHLPLLRAADGIEALEILERPDVLPPLVILLDLNMPRMNGLEFLHALRADARFVSLPVHVITTSDYHKDIDEAYRHSISGYYIKPSTGAEMVEITKSLTHLAAIGRYPNTPDASRLC